MQHLSSGRDKGRTKYSETILLWCQFFHHKLDMECADILAGSLKWDARNLPNEPSVFTPFKI